MSGCNKDLYEFYKGYNICAHCGQNKAAPGIRVCFECRDKQNQRARRRRERETEEEREIRLAKAREYNKKQREVMKEEKKCILCNKKAIDKSNTFCLEHYLDNKKNNDERKQSININDRKNYGICYVCSAPVGKRGSMCDKCYGKVVIPDFIKNRR